MGVKRRQLVIRNMPFRGGLVTAGQQSSIAENQLWKMENISSEYDGMVHVRPGIKQWGHKIRSLVNSETDKLAFWEDFLTRDQWTEVDDSAGRMTFTEQDGFVQADMRPTSSGTGDWLYYRNVHGSETTPDSDEWAVRTYIKFQGLADGTPAVAEPMGYVTLTITAGANSIRRLAFGEDGVFYQSGATAWTLIASSTGATDGAWHMLEISFDATDDTLSISIDDATALTATASYDASFDTGNLMEFKLNTNDSISQYSLHLSSIIYTDAGSSGFADARVHDIIDFAEILESGVTKRYILVAAGEYVYTDRGMRQWWFPLLQVNFGRARFASYRGKIIIFDYDINSTDAVAYEWDGSTITELTDMPKCRFGKEHRSRLWTAGDRRHPRRIYFSASRQSNVWFSPEDDDDEETYSEVTEAGYIEIPSFRGLEVTGIWGDYYGDLIVGTNKGTWRITGASPASFALRNISPDVGPGGPDAMTQFGNVLWMCGVQGVANLSVSEQYGDIQTTLPSGAVQDLWTNSPNVNAAIEKDLIGRVQMTYDNPNGLVYLSIPERDGEGDSSAIYVYNVNTQNWQGPWDIAATACRAIDVESPIQQVVMVGTSGGLVGYVDYAIKSDFGTSYVWTMETPLFDGRSLDARLVPEMKTWKRLLLYIIPKGDWLFDVYWYTDSDAEQKRLNINQNVYKLPVLSSTSEVADNAFRLDTLQDGTLESEQMAAIIEIPLDARGRWIYLKITGGSTSDPEDFVMQGYELHFEADGFEQEG
ncbi:MAG: hypothetical protein AMJ65_01615 [Phycisphaerae bacterium SG8_4]|nr:MAG: hypothetical protein AMJ65_01615 [Phycisphaerae bacterium SG8_4]